MIFGGYGIARAKRRAYQDLVEALGGDAQMADDLIASHVDGEPTLADLRWLVRHAREVESEIAEEEEPNDAPR